MDVLTIEITLKKITWKKREYFDQQIYVNKSTWKQSEFFYQRYYTEKSTWKKHDFFDHQITTKKVCRNDVDFLSIEITSKNCKKNDVDFSIIKITLKKYVEMTWKFIKIWSLTYRCNIDVVRLLRFLSIPRLELTAAVLPVQMPYLIRKKLNLGTVAEKFWTDSQVVSAYIRSTTKRFNIFVVSQIQKSNEDSDVSQWILCKTNTILLMMHQEELTQ